MFGRRNLYTHRVPLPTGHIYQKFPQLSAILDGEGNSSGKTNDRSINNESSHASHQYTPRSFGQPTQGRKFKVEPNGHPPLALAAFSISNVALVGQRSYRCFFAAQ